jgi:hypothetical protein
MNIINCEIIPSRIDDYWDVDGDFVKTLTSVSVLVISNQIQSDSSRFFLLKMIGACGLNSSQYHIVEMQADKKVPWYKIRDIARPKVVLLFGVIPPRLAISALFNLYEPNKFDNVIWIAAPDLELLEQSVEMKSRLWNDGMKIVFTNPVIISELHTRN